MARTTILAEQTLEFEYLSEIGFFGHGSSGLFVLEEGKEYIVSWDGTEWTCSVYVGDYLAETGYYLGNKEFIEAFVKGESAELVEPFIIFQALSDGYNAIFAGDTSASHTVAIYQEIAEEDPPDTLILLDRDGSPLKFKGANSLRINRADGTKQTFISGEAVEGLVDPDFSNGDMVVTSEEGKLFSKLTISQPETLIPANIAEGVEIAGIIGTMAAGKPIKIYTKYNFKPSSSLYTLEHNLGVIPDIIIIYPLSSTASAKSGYLAFSDAFYSCLPYGARKQMSWRANTSGGYGYQNTSITATSGDIRNANENSFQIYSIPTSIAWNFILIAGLT